MDSHLREAQKSVLKIFSEKATKFALAGGTALEMYYLNHRFSLDLDFFSPHFDLQEIDQLIQAFKNQVDKGSF